MSNPSPNASFVPAGWPRVTPRIVVHEARALVGFIKDVFDAVGDYEDGAPSILRLGDSIIMVSGTGERQTMHAFLYVYVLNADDAFQRAIAAGARAVEEPRDLPYGDRRGMVEDPWGNTWQIAHRSG